MANESTKWLYEQLTGKGYNVGKDVDEFDNLMRTNAESRRWAYETATNAGFNVGKDIDEFTSLVAPQPIQAAADVVANATNRIQPSVAGTEENGNNVPVVTPNQAAADEVDPVNDTQQSWTPSVQDRIRASYQMHTMLNDFNQKSRERIAQARRLTEPFTADGRKKRSALAFQTQLAGSPTKVMGVTGPTPKSTADEVHGETEGATRQRQPDTQSPVPYGVEYVDGKPVTRWLMPDGSVTTNIAEADAAEYVAKQQRLHDTYRKNTKDISFNIPKGKSVRVGVEMSYGRPVVVWRLPDGSFKKSYATADDEKFISDFQQRIGNFDQGLAVSKFNETSNAIGKNYAKYAAEAWADAEDKYEKKVSAANSAAYSGYGGRENRIVAAGSARHGEMVAHLESFDLEKMMDNAWDRIGEQGQRELIADCLQLLEQNNPAGDRNEMQKAAVEMARNISDNNVYNYALERNTPKSKLEFFVRKIADVNPMIALSTGMARKSTSAQGDVAAYNQAMSEYGEAHKFLDAAGFVSGLIFDPVNLISMGAGSVAGKTVTALATKTSGGLGTRLLANSWKGRALASAASGAGYMASFEGLGDMRQQFVDGGWTDSNGEFHEGFSMAHALKKGGTGALLGTGMGLWGSGVGNVFTKATKATDNVIGKVGIRAAQVPVSVIGEGTIFAMPEIIEFHTMEDDAFDKLYAEKFGYADETDVYKRNKARDAARNSLAWDAWNKSQATIFAIKVSGKAIHGLSHPRETIGHVTKTLSELRGKDVREHRSFAERVSQMMDRSPFDIILTKEEREELRRAGYGELSELFRKDSNNGSTRTGVSPAEGAVEQYTERMEAEEIGGRRPEFDGYSEMERLMHDGSVSEAARAKAYYILTGHMLPMSTVTGYTKTAGEDGKITVNAVNARGEVVTSRIFRNEAKAQDEVDNITRQAELNTVDMGERYAEAQAQMRVAETAFSEVGAKHNIISDGVRNIYEKYGMGEKLSDAELAIVNDVNKLVAERMLENDTLRPESFRKHIQDNSGVDVDAALRKTADKRTEQEQEAVNDYVDMLYKEAARDKKAREMWGDEYGQMREEERAERRRQYKSMLDGKLLEGSEPTPEQAEAQNQYEHGRELYGRFEEGDPTVQPDVDAIALRMQEAYEVFNDAFGAEAEEYMFLANENPWALFNNPELTIERQDAVLYYINAKAALDGVMDASNEAANRKRDEVEQSVAKRTHKDSGVIIPATMKVDDRQVYVVKGDVAMFPDGAGVDVRNSSESVIVMDAQTGEYEFTSPDQILKVSEVINPQDELDTALSEIEQEQMNVFGNNAVVPEESVEQPRASTESLSDTIRTEDVTDAQAVPETAETVSSKATELLTEDKNAAAVVSDAETVPQTVLSRIPVDEQGEPMLTHESVDAETAWDGAVEFFGSDADAQSYVDAQVKNVTAAITAAEKAVDKVKPTGGMKKYKDDLAKARAAVDSAKGVLARWQAISQVSQGRKAEAEAEATAQRAYEESITRGKEELKQAYDEVKDVPEAVEILRNMEPQSIDEVAALLLSGSKVLWNDEGVKRGVKSMLGYGEGERKGLFGLFATSKNGGETLERLAEDKMEELCNVYGIEYDNYDALTALTDVLGACRTRGDLTKYIQSRRIEQAIQAKDDFMRHIEEETERMSQEAYHMSVAERDAYEEQLFKDISRKEITDADIAEMNAIFADEIIERQRYEDNIRNEQRGAEDVLPSGTAVLQGTPADYGGRVPEASSGERGVAGNGSVDRAHGAAPEGAPGTVAQIERLSKKYRSAPMKIVNSVDEIDAEDLSKETKEQIKLAHGEEGTQAVYCHENKKIYIFAGKYHDNGIDYIAAHENVHAAVDKFGLRDSEELSYWHKGVISLFSDELPNDVDEILREGIPAADFEDEFAAYTIPWISGNKRRLSKVLTSGDNWLINLFKTISEDVYGKEESERRCSLAIQDKEGADIHARPGKGLRGPGGENRGREDAAERGNDTTGSPDSEAGGNLKRRGIEQSDKVSDDFYDGEEQALAARVEVTDNDWEEGDESTPTYKRDIIIDGIHKVTQVDAPDADGYYNGSYFEFDGKRFGDLKEVADYIAGGMHAEPTEAQKAAGNYKMEHRRVDGYNISIENAKGSVRRGTGADGKPWETVMQNDYGYIRGTEGVDGDHIDVFLSDTPEDGDVFVVDQVNEDGSFDEHKVMYGFPTEQAARDSYLSNYEPGWTGLGAITHVSKDEFKKWIQSSRRKTKPFADYASIKRAESAGEKPIETSFSIGKDASSDSAAYETAKGLLESTGIEVVEVSGEEAQAMLGQKNTPVDGQPNRANEKLTSGSVLLSISGNSSSNRAASKEAEAKLQKKTLSAKNKITKFRNGDYSIDTETLDKAMSGIGKMFAMDTKGGTRYAILKAENGDTIALRLGDHAANGNNFARDNADQNVSIVIERKRYDMPGSEIEFTEATIAEATFKERPKEVVNAIVDGVDGLLRGDEFTLDESIGRIEKKGVNDKRFHIRTYHGTGADFDKFDLQYVGSGEGARSFGWGGYVTEVKGIGKGYATRIGGKELLPKIEKVSENIRQVRQWLKSNEDYDNYARECNKHLKELQREYKAAEKSGDKKDMQLYRGLIELQEQQFKPENHAALIADKYRQIESYQKELDTLNRQLEQRRHLYTVRIPDDTGDNYLDWGGKIADRIRDKISLQAVVEGVSLDFYGDKIAAAGYSSKMGDDAVGYQLYRSLVRALGSDKSASEFLSRAGLTGIKYAAGYNNGGRSDGKKNYVVFKDSDMKISGHIKFLRTPEGTVYGWVADGKVYLNRDAMNPETPLHEYTHLWDDMVKKENPELWARGKELMKQTPLWEEMMNDPNYVDIRDDEDAVASEVHSRLTGKRGAKRIEEMMKEAAAEPDIVEKAKKFNLVHQLKRWLSDMFKNLKKTLSKWSKQDLRDLTAGDFADLTLRDLAEWVDPGQVSGDTRFQIMGERGIQRLDAAEEVSSRLDNLAVAREMEKDKVDAHTIRIATGWERGADGLWRYEIPDFKIDPTGQARKNSLWVNLPWGKEFDRLTDKVLDGAELTREESIQFDELSERAEEMRKTYEESEIRYLDDYVIDESLFTAYPGLRQIRIEMYSDPESRIGGTYYEKENLLRLNERLFDIGDLRSILVHEVQHAIQAEEGFARGGSVRNIRDMALNRIATNGYFLREFTPSQLYDLRLLRQKAEEKIKNGKYKRLSSAIKQVLKEAKKYSSYVWLDRHDNNEDSYMTVYDALNRYAADELYAAAQLDEHQLYNRVSGEVEARNAEKRMMMSDDERRQTLLRDTEDVSRDDQIFLMDLPNRSAVDGGLLSESGAAYADEVREPEAGRRENEEARMAELAEKYAKYAKLDKSVGTASDITLTDEDSTDTPTTGDGNKYRLIAERELLDFLDAQPLKKGYRYSQWANMGVLPPMTAKQNGEWRAPMIFSRWEQSEEGMRKENGKADLVQGNGRTTGDVAYNPYFHIRTSPLNDQFTAAYDRPELLVIEGHYPESEETSGYQAEGAKDSVGLMDWHSGSVNGQLSDDTKVQTMLSRYFKPVRIVPWSEVADLIMERVGDQKITFPINAVPPMLRAELAKRGAKFGDISGSVAEADIPMLNELRDRVNAGEWGAGLEKARAYLDAYESSTEAKEARVADLSARANTPVHIVRTQEEADALPTRRERRAKGWWSAKDDEVVIVLPNNVNVADVDNTFVHEVAGHKGLRAFIGEERFDEFLGEIYDHASNPIRKVIDKMTDKMVNEETDRLRVRKAQAHERAGEDVNANYYTDMAEARVEAEKKREEFRKEATEEYMSDLGGRIGSEGFEKMSRDELTLWGKIKAKVQAFLDKFLQGLKIAKSIRLNDKDLSYILYKSWKNLRKKGVFADAEDAVMRRRTGYDADEVTRFRDPGLGLEETITKMKAEAMQANAGNLQAKRDAMRAIGGNLNHLRQAMARQREYDITTVKSVADLARVLMDNNLLDDLSKYETKRILGAINNVVGKQDVSQYVQKVMDIMVDNQLRMGANTLGRLLSIRGSRVDARGIEVQGELDPDGQRIAQVVRKSTSLPKDDIDNRIAEAINRMSSTDQAIADEATIEYAGLQIARQYVEDITESKAEEKALRDSIREAKEAKDAGQMTEDAYRQYVESTEDAIRQNKIERAEAFHSLVEQVGGVLSESVERAKAWREAEKQRVEEIHHNANSDMEGRPTDEHHKDDRMQKLANNSFARFLLSPLATFDQMLRMFGKKNSRGEGYLWNRYMRDWVAATEKEYTGYRDALKVLDAKVSEIYGKDMTWGDLFTIDRKLPKASVRFFDGGEMKDHELTQGNLLYIYMADKMSDGRMKLRRMGITEEDIEDIKNFLDPKFMQLADWMQEEFLVDKRNEYNEVHKRMFGASMAAIENYFPLKILANARLEDVDVADDTTDTALPATSTGSIIKRRRNNLALDVTGANAFSVILDHLQQMERWAAFAEFNRDLNTLLSYKRFRNQVMNMSSVYGGGKTLWNNFRNVCSMAAGAYRPPIAALDKSAVNIAKGVTAAKVNFRVFTALKQFLSMPAYISDSNPIHLAANIANPYGAWKWSMENLPLFEKRWRSRMAGDPRLLKSDMDWKMWRSRVVEIASRIGMSPNAFVDALTVAIGSHAMYQSRLAKYKRYGHDPDVAEARAKQDATILFNQTQQSSEGAFLSTMQVDRSWLSVLFTVFRNSSMSYTRQLYDSIRNLSRRFTLGYKGLSEEFMAKQMRRDGIDPDKADRNAKQEFRRGIIRDLVRVGIFGYVLQLAWNLGSYLPYLIFGNDDDEKDKMWQDVWNHTVFGSIEGLTGGDVMSAAGNMWVSGEGNPQYLTKDMPLVSDVFAILKKIDKDKVSAMNDVINLLVQSTIGVNPQSLTDPVVAVIDACGNDAQTSRECALLIARIINCPQSQLDKIYFDELGATGEEASQMTPYEIAERYARYKVRRGAPLTGWAYGNEQREKLMDKYRKKSNTLAKERLTRETDTQASRNMAQWLEEFEATKDRVSEIKKVKSRDEDQYYELLDELEMTPEYERYEIIKGYKREVDALTKEWLRATTAAQRDSCVQAIIGLKGEMARELIDTQQ